ncbi:hypothetical protein ACK37C_19980 [Aeromonas veronii]
MFNDYEVRIPDFHRDLVNAVCRHEVGHFYMAISCNFEASGIDVTFNGNGTYVGGAAVTIIRDSNQKIEHLIRGRIKVLMAGVVSEMLDVNGEVNVAEAIKLFDTTASSDKVKIDEHLHILRCIIEPQAKEDGEIKGVVDKLCGEIWSETIDLIQKNHNSILEVSEGISKEIIISSKNYHFDRASIEALLLT